jgi:hypothetical protein
MYSFQLCMYSSCFRFNLNKFLSHESRDAATIFADRSSTDSDWVKYAKVSNASATLKIFLHEITLETCAASKRVYMKRAPAGRVPAA